MSNPTDSRFCPKPRHPVIRAPLSGRRAMRAGARQGAVGFQRMGAGGDTMNGGNRARAPALRGSPRNAAGRGADNSRPLCGHTGRSWARGDAETARDGPDMRRKAVKSDVMAR